MASLAMTAVRKTLAPFLVLLGVLVWLSNEGAGGPEQDELREACTALARHHAELAACPDSLQELGLPHRDGSSARPGLAYAIEGDSCSIAITEGRLIGESCTVP